MLHLFLIHRLYPTSFPETGCITLLKAMTFGSIPITSKYENSVIKTLAEDSGFDLGPQRMLTFEMSKNKKLFDSWLYEDYLNSIKLVLDRVKNRDISLEKHRLDMIQSANMKFTWESSANILVNHISLYDLQN